MADWNEDLEALFVLFHDFTLKEVHQQDDRITLRISVPWGEMLNPPDLDYTITVILAGCSDLFCDYWTLKTDPASLSKIPASRGQNAWRTDDNAAITALGLEVQSHARTAPDHFVLHANSSVSIHGAPIAGGDLSFRALAFQLYDADNKPMALQDLQAWGTAWWKSAYEGQLLRWPRP